MVAVYLVKGSSLSVLSWDGEREPVLLERQRLDTLYATVKAALVACTPPIAAPTETQTILTKHNTGRRIAPIPEGIHHSPL